MKTYALKYKNHYYQFTQNKSKLDVYKHNKITSIVELKIIKDEFGKFWLFEEENGDIIIETIEVMFNGKIEGKTGKTFKIDFEEI